MDRLADTVERLMQTLALTVQGDNEERTQLLSSTKLKTTVNSGTLTYRFTPELVALLKESSIFAKLDLAVMRGFGSRYAFSLYEQTARRIRLQHKMTDTLSLDELRQLLGVEDGKLTEFKNLNTRAIQPAVTEVNAISPWTVSILPVKDGKKVARVIYGWSVKDTSGQKVAYAELQRHRTGRKQRLDGTVESISGDDDDAEL
jgi:plasmid replication initiation protein